MIKHPLLLLLLVNMIMPGKVAGQKVITLLSDECSSQFYIGQADDEPAFLSFDDKGNESFKFYDQNLKEKTVPAERSDLGGTTTAILVGDQIILLHAGAHEKKYKTYAALYDSKGGLIEKPFPIFERPFLPKELQPRLVYTYSNFSPIAIDYSPDTSKILIAYTYVNRKDDRVVCDYAIFDRKLEMVYSKQVTFPYSSRHALLEQIIINNSGHVFILARNYLEKDLKKDEVNNNECYVIRAGKDIETSLTRLSRSNEFLINVSMLINSKDELALFGFYNTSGWPTRNLYDGVYIFKWKSATDTVSKHYRFTAEMDKRSIGSEIGTYSDGQLANISVRSIYEFRNGNYLLLGDHSYGLNYRADIFSFLISDTGFVSMSIFKRHPENSTSFVSYHDTQTDSVFISYKHSKGTFDEYHFNRGVIKDEYPGRQYALRDMSLNHLFFISIGKDGGYGIRKLEYGWDLYPADLIKVDKRTWLIPTINCHNPFVFGMSKIGVLNPARKEKMLVIRF